MKRVLFFILLPMVCLAGSPENLRLKEWGTPIPARTHLDVRWSASTNAFPSSIWVYHVLPNRFSPEVVSNLLALCSLSDDNLSRRDTNEMTFRSANGSRKLSISFLPGKITFGIGEPHYGPANLAQGVPAMSEMPNLAANFLAEVGIDLSDIQRNTNGAPKIDFWEPSTWYFVNHTFITNIEFRAFDFRRAVDGIVVSGGDGGEIRIGEQGNICKISLAWQKLKRYKACPVLSPEAMIECIRKGKAVHGGVLMSFGDIDWPTIRSVTIKMAKPSFYAGDPDTHSDWLYPFAALLATVDTGHGIAELEIDCPVIDDEKAQ